VERFARGQLQPLDFVLDHQFAALQLDYGQIIRGWMGESFVQFAFQNPMFAFQFNEMRLYCHYEISSVVKPQIRSGRRSVHKPANLSMDFADRRAHVFGFICNQS
jgi:hypothetical protein